MDTTTIFLTRKFPPQKGGMETFSFQLTQHFPGQKKVIAHGSRQIDIIWVAPLLVVRGLLISRKTKLFHLGDLVLGPAGKVLKLLTKKPVVATVHGLELTYSKAGSFYTWLINWSLSSIDAFVCVSEHTAQLLRERGIAANKITVITHGVMPWPKQERSQARKYINEQLKLGLSEYLSGNGNTADNNTPVPRPILLTVGRLVKRKGVAWFIEKVLPELSELNPLYIITSDGPERENIETAIKTYSLGDKVKLVGKVSDEMLYNLYYGADIFVMPNIKVEGDAEGFGFVAIEAAAAALPVVSSKLEGITDAIQHDKNGILVEPEDAQEYAKVIRQWVTHSENRLAFAERAQKYTWQNFKWDDVALKYDSLFEKVINGDELN